MRDVTDNRTGELEVGEAKRGRGRPRKANAMSNAERQAAYRARRRAAVTVTKNLSAPRLIVDQVDAYDECRLEVEALRAELAEAHETIDELQQALTDELQQRRELIQGNQEAFAKLDKLRAELAAAKKGAAKSVTRNENRETQLYAEIKRSSKYYGQTAAGELFRVRILPALPGGEYVVQGGPGGQYRLKDVWLWAVEDEGKKVRLS
ncbi:hypothetical protein [Cupriavidus taiwanensis]|uniref:Uncharacterized protein n=1 Tax=Cupriavidus taiwanensis TaxID=164546 RepID=A0A976AAT0_9BURK|nr:hypothetical protein CBM2587_P10002 [Cupriavidus taiwanensis]